MAGELALNREQVRNLLEAVRGGELATADALERLSNLPFTDLPDARVDTHRALRHGIPEVVYAPGKTPEQIVEIVSALREAEQDVLVTRVDTEVGERVLAEAGGGTYDAVARLLWYGPAEVPAEGKGTIAVVSAGTSDLPGSDPPGRIYPGASTTEHGGEYIAVVKNRSVWESLICSVFLEA